MIAFTTCRKPGKNTKTLAKNLALLTDGLYVARGRKGVQEAVEFAAGKGFARLCFVNEEKGEPSELAFFEKTWIGELKIKGVKYYGGIKRVSATCEALDADGDNACKLLGLEAEEEREANIKASNRSVVFEIEGKKVAELFLK